MIHECKKSFFFVENIHFLNLSVQTNSDNQNKTVKEFLRIDTSHMFSIYMVLKVLKERRKQFSCWSYRQMLNDFVSIVLGRREISVRKKRNILFKYDCVNVEI